MNGGPEVQAISPPDYKYLLDWWKEWPACRPEILDFWARGNFAKRIQSRREMDRHACTVRVRYVDEMTHALRRLALLGMEIDFAVDDGNFSTELVMVPQHVDYESAGGHGYLTATGDEMDNGSGRWEYAPAMGMARLLPDTVVDWMAEDATAWVRSGQVLVCPASNIGLAAVEPQAGDANTSALESAMTISQSASLSEVMFSLNLPTLDAMTLADVQRFCSDHGDSLARMRHAITKLVGKGWTEANSPQLKEVVCELEDSVAELRLADRMLEARKSIVALGGTLSTFALTVGVQTGFPIAYAAVGAGTAAMAALAMWQRNSESESTLAVKPYRALWQLSKVKPHSTTRQQRPQQWEMLRGMQSSKAPSRALAHWLVPPTPGWDIPTGFIPA